MALAASILNSLVDFGCINLELDQVTRSTPGCGVPLQTRLLGRSGLAGPPTVLRSLDGFDLWLTNWFVQAMQFVHSCGFTHR